MSDLFCKIVLKSYIVLLKINHDFNSGYVIDFTEIGHII